MTGKTAEIQLRLKVRGLWKVFGSRSQVQTALQISSEADKAIIQAQTKAVVAVKNVSFEVYRGEVFVVMGLSGSGKSTLVRCLTRLIEPTRGAIEVDGEDILQFDDVRLREFRRKKVAMVFQHFGLLPHRRVIDNVAFGLEVQSIAKKERYSKAAAMLDKVGLTGWESHYPWQLSGGMQQRVGLARALALDPEILLMDEPFSGLDPLIRRNMQDELLRLERELNKTIVFITHDLNEALRLGDRIAIMRDGEIVQTGHPEDIVLNPQGDYVKEFTRDVRRETVLNAAKVMTEPELVIKAQEDPKIVLKILRASKASVAMVVDEQGRYQGAVSEKQAREALSEGIGTIGECCPTNGVSSITPETSFEDLIPLVLISNGSVPVVDEKGVLIGEVRRSDVGAVMRRGK